MNSYVTGATVKALREARKLTQADLAEMIGVSSKTVSKWETGKGLPDISLLQPLAQALNISVIELMNGEHIINRRGDGICPFEEAVMDVHDADSAYTAILKKMDAMQIKLWT